MFQRPEFDDGADLLKKERSMPHVTSMEKRGIKIGRKQGIRRGQIQLLLHVATNLFGELPTRIRKQVELLAGHQIQALAADIFKLNSLSEFRDWLKTH